MKKFTLILALMLTVGLVGAFAEVTVSGDVEHVIEVGEDTSQAFFTKGRVYFKSGFGEFSSATLSFDGMKGTDVEPMVRDLYLQSDLAGALGIDAVSLDATVGSFYAAFTNGHLANWHDLRTPYFSMGRAIPGAIKLDLGIDPVVLHVGTVFSQGAVADNPDTTADETVVADDKILAAYAGGISGDFGGASFFLTYADADAKDDNAGSAFFAEAAYDLAINDMTSVLVPVYFKYDLDAETWGYNAGVRATYDMVGVGAALVGDDVEALRNVDLDAEVAVTDAANVYVAAYLNLEADDNLQGLEVGANYKLDMVKFQAGYFLAADSVVTASDRYGWYGTPAQSGFYIATDIAW